MKRMALTLVLLAGLGGLLGACGGGQPQTPVAEGTPVEADNRVIAEAKVVPERSAALSFQDGGVVVEVLVEEGKAVTAGELIARLDGAERAANLARAEAQLRAAEARLQDLTDGPRAEDAEAAQAQVRQAEAQLQQTVGAVTPQDISAAQSQIQAAEATLNRLKAGAQSAEVRGAQAQLQQAQAALETQRAQLSAGKTQAELQLQQAADALVQAQTTYSTAKYRWEFVERTGDDPITPEVPDSSRPGKTKDNELNDFGRQTYLDAFKQAEANLHSAELGVQQAQAALDTARQAEIAGVQGAESSVVGAQANLDRISGSVENEELALAKSQLAQAQASLAKMRGPQREFQIAAAQAGLEVAQASLTKLQAPAQPSELTAMQAQVDSAKAELEAARVALAHTELRAPFAGVIASLDLRVGEAIQANSAVVQLADTSEWKIETTDLTELNVAQVQAGDAAVLTFDALPDLELPGRVERITGYGENRQGDIVYRVVVKPDSVDPRLRWNMTASVAITPQSP